MLHVSQALRTHRARLLIWLGLPLACLAATATNAHADALVVDNADPSVQVTGDWQSSSSTPGFYGGDYLFRRAANGSSLVKWPFPDSGAPGRYMVFARWTSGSNRASAVKFLVTSADGVATVRQNQRTEGGRWQALGTYTFRPGKQLSVSLSDMADGVVIADAISWIGPLSPGNVSIEPAKVATARDFQHQIDEGEQPWRLDPLETARADAIALGVAPGGQV